MNGLSLWKQAAALILLALLTLAGCKKEEQKTAANSTEQVHWKMASTFPGTLPVLGTGGHAFSERVAAASGGRIQLTFYDPNKLVPPLEIFDAVGKGAIDAGWSVSGYWIGKIPAAAFFTSVPFGPASPEFFTWLYRGGGYEIWKEIYARSNIFPIPCGVVSPDGSGWFREPIEKPEDLRGKKLRYFGLGGEVMQKLGASVQLLAGGDIYPALERGILDGLEFAQPVVDKELGFYRIAKHYYFPGWHQQDSVLELIVNMDRWKALDAGGQALIEMACQESIVRMLAESESVQGPALDFFKTQGVQFHVWSPEMLKAYRDAYQKVLEEDSAKDADFKRVYESYKKFRQSYTEWYQLGRVPRDPNQ